MTGYRLWSEFKSPRGYDEAVGWRRERFKIILDQAVALLSERLSWEQKSC
jgi:hypothetical protein